MPTESSVVPIELGGDASCHHDPAWSLLLSLPRKHCGPHNVLHQMLWACSLPSLVALAQTHRHFHEPTERVAQAKVEYCQVSTFRLPAVSF